MENVLNLLSVDGRSVYLSSETAENLARELAWAISPRLIRMAMKSKEPRVFAVQRGGVPVAYLLKQFLRDLQFVDAPERADFIVDDIIDSGSTRDQFPEEMPFFSLVSKVSSSPKKSNWCSAYKIPDHLWVVFPWERSLKASSEDTIVRLLEQIGENPRRGGLLETPKRVVAAWSEWTSGYSKDPATLLKVFEDGAERADEMIVVRDIPVYSHCEHHLAPFFGVAHVGYLARGKIVGLSKISRLVDIFARRLQVQERLTNQVADAINEHLDPRGVGVVIECRHLCMESRGIKQQGSKTSTSALRGLVKEQPALRAEFFSLIR